MFCFSGLRFVYAVLTYIQRYARFTWGYLRFRQLTVKASPVRFPVRWRDRMPCLCDATLRTEYDRHYVYHSAWAARVLARIRPALHIDISSNLYFVSLVSAFMPVQFFDYRPADLALEGLACERGDLLDLPFADGSVLSLSCMHVVEHVGLGRYGDPLDPEGDAKAMGELERVIAPGGSLLFVTPIGRPVLRFNGHRIYSPEQILKQFSSLRLIEFVLIPEHNEDGPPIRNPTPEQVAKESYGCGCFWFYRPG